MLPVDRAPLAGLGEIQRIHIGAGRHVVGQEFRRFAHAIEGFAELASLAAPCRPNPGALDAGGANLLGQRRDLLPGPCTGKGGLLVAPNRVAHDDHHEIGLFRLDQLLDRFGLGAGLGVGDGAFVNALGPAAIACLGRHPVSGRGTAHPDGVNLGSPAQKLVVKGSQEVVLITQVTVANDENAETGKCCKHWKRPFS